MITNWSTILKQVAAGERTAEDATAEIERDATPFITFAEKVLIAIGYRGGSGPDEQQVAFYDSVLMALLDASGVAWRRAPLKEVAPKYAELMGSDADEMPMIVVGNRAVSYDRWGWVGNNLITQADELDQGSLMQTWLWLTQKDAHA